MHHYGWLIGATLLGGCASDLGDPYQRPGTYRPDGANVANLRVMIVNPVDLIGGVGESTSIGAEAAAPVERQLGGKRYPLPVVSAGTTAPGNAQAPPPGASAPGLGAQ